MVGKEGIDIIIIIVGKEGIYNQAGKEGIIIMVGKEGIYNYSG